MEREKTYRMHIDPMGFAEKPDKEGDGAIKKLIPRTSHNIAEVTAEEFVELIASGHSFIPGLCNMESRKFHQGALQKDWEEQSWYFLDFDNEDVMRGEKLVKKIEYISLFDAVEKFRTLGLSPAIAYRTYSDGKLVNGVPVEKFRIGFKTAYAVTDRNTRDKLQAVLMGLMEAHIDPQCSNRNRYFNGTSASKVELVSFDAEILAEAVIEQYWNESFVAFLPGDSELKRPEARTARESNVISFEIAQRRHRNSRNYTPTEDFPCVRPAEMVHNGLIVYDMNEHYDELMELAEEQISAGGFDKEGTGRRTFIFTVFNAVSFKYDTRIAYEKCIEFNERFGLPLCTSEFNKCTWNALKHLEECCVFFHETQFVYRYETQLSSLGISEEKQKELSYFKNRNAKEHANRYRNEKQEMHDRIRELYLEGYRKTYIAKKLAEEFPLVAISVDGVKSYIRDHKSEWVQGGAFGTITIYNNNYFSSPEEQPASPVLHPEQEEAVQYALGGSNTVVTGFAGTGKSVVTNAIREGREQLGYAVAVVAATGVAAYNVGGKTLHSFFNIYGENEHERRITNDLLLNISEYDTVIVEEAGMVKAKDFYFVCEVLEKVRRRYHKNIQLVLVCDILQLPPVNDGFFFQTNCYRSLNFRHFYLTENFRQQQDAEYAFYLNKVRVGTDKELTACELNRICSRTVDERYTYIVPYKREAARYNNARLASLDGDLVDLGNNQFVKLGAKIIVTENYSRRGVVQYFNGMQGELVGVSENKNAITMLTTDGRIVTIRRKLVNMGEELVNGFPIALGYAVTIHKSQGMTLEGANIDPRTFTEGQLYVALSRVKNSSGVHLLRPILPEYIKVDQSALAFDNEMRKAGSFQVAM